MKDSIDFLMGFFMGVGVYFVVKWAVYSLVRPKKSSEDKENNL